MEARAGDFQHLAQPFHAEGATVIINELETAHPFVSPAKYFAARRRSSRSVSSSRIRALSCLFSFSSISSEVTSACWATGGPAALPTALACRARSARIQLRSVSRLMPRSLLT